MITNALTDALSRLVSGEPVAIPTETVYGLAANAFNLDAISKVYQLKGRPEWNPLIVHIGKMEQLPSLVGEIPQKARLVMEHFWPGPLTVVLPKTDAVPDSVTSGQKTVAIRMPAHPVALDLLQQLPFPLVAPSANPFSRISPTDAKSVEAYFGDALLVLEGGPCDVGIESTILSFKEELPQILRLGKITQNEIESLIGRVEVKNTPTEKPEAPGMIRTHYAPTTPAFFMQNPMEVLHDVSNLNVGCVFFSEQLNVPIGIYSVVLSKSGSLEEASKNLFATLSELDRGGFDLLLLQAFPDEGMGLAVNDRLYRASLPMSRLKEFLNS
jgi:L-threonylcarbamoyladenylate synthase